MSAIDPIGLTSTTLGPVSATMIAHHHPSLPEPRDEPRTPCNSPPRAGRRRGSPHRLPTDARPGGRSRPGGGGAGPKRRICTAACRVLRVPPERRAVNKGDDCPATCGKGHFTHQGVKQWIVDFLAEDEEWKKRAACRDKDPASFFPERGQHHQANGAMIVCMSCPVMAECEDYRVRTKSEYGVWAGQLHTRKEGKDS